MYRPRSDRIFPHIRRMPPLLPEPNAFYLAHIHPGTCAQEAEEGEPHEHGNHAEEGHEHGGEIEYQLSQVNSDSQGHGSSTNTLRETSVDKLFSGEPKHVNVHEAGSGNPPILSCADLKRAGQRTAENRSIYGTS
jgi:hypothetical protein